MKHFLYTSIAAILLFPAIALAGGIGQAGGLLENVGEGAGAGDLDISTAIGSGINIALSLVGLIFLILMVYAGFMWITSRGDEGQVDKARKTIVASVIGLVIVVSSYAITAFVGAQF